MQTVRVTIPNKILEQSRALTSAYERYLYGCETQRLFIKRDGKQNDKLETNLNKFEKTYYFAIKSK